MGGYTVSLTTKKNTAESANFHPNQEQKHEAEAYSCYLNVSKQLQKLRVAGEHTESNQTSEAFIPNHRFVELFFDLDIPQ